MTWWQWLLLILAAYYATCAWLVYGRGPFKFVYNPVIALLLKAIGMACLCLGARGYVRERKYLQPEYSAPGTPLWRHEKETHYDKQWRVRPFTFAPEYLWKFITKGYEHIYFEDDAEKAEHPE
jgi:hypothetical protein